MSKCLGLNSANFSETSDLVKTISENNTFSTGLDFNITVGTTKAKEIYYLEGNPAGAITFTISNAPTENNIWLYTQFTSDGSGLNLPTLDAWKTIKNEYIGTSARYYLLVFYTNSIYIAQIIKITNNVISDIVDLIWDNTLDMNIVGNTMTGTSVDGKGESLTQVLSGDGYIESDINRANSQLAVIGLDTSTGLQVYTDFDFGMYNNDTSVRVRIGASQTLYTRSFTNAKIRMERTDTDMEFWFQPDGGAWELLQTENSVTTADLYLKGAVIQSGRVVDNVKAKL